MNHLTDFIVSDIKPLQTSQTLEDAQSVFLEFPYSHFPVCDAGVYIGCISKDTVDVNDENKPIDDLKFNFERFYVRDTMVWLDVLEEFGKNECTLLPVLNSKNDYLGYYELEDVFQFFQNSIFIKEQGNIIVVQKAKADYSFSQISQIVEGNGGRILGIFVSTINEQMVEITLKVSLYFLNEILQSFRRYDYEIVSKHQEDSYLENLKERSEYLNKYLNI